MASPQVVAFVFIIVAVLLPVAGQPPRLEVLDAAYGTVEDQDRRSTLTELIHHTYVEQHGVLNIGPKLGAFVGYDPVPNKMKFLFLHLRVDGVNYMEKLMEGEQLNWRPLVNIFRFSVEELHFD